MTWHLTAIAFLNLVFVFAGHLEPQRVGVFSALDINRFWPLYVLVGVVGPLALAESVRYAMTAFGSEPRSVGSRK